tara:strand:- start:318 stop:536 length:219 start_codon:yes stop_codon:yes gene_type:complete
MKITKQQLKQIIKEELEEAMLTLEMFDTGSAGDESGGSSLEDKKKQCAATKGRWVEGEKDEFGKPVGGYCDK